MALLETKQVSKIFGGLTAVNKMDFVIDEGQICSIIGPNGAGKTTFFNTLTGIYKPEHGEIHFIDQSLVGKRPDQIASIGISRTFQNIRLFGNMSVVENVLVGMFTRLKESGIGTVFRSRGFKKRSKGLTSERWMSWNSSAWVVLVMSWHAICLTACSAEWRLPGHWPPIRNCCCWTSLLLG